MPVKKIAIWVAAFMALGIIIILLLLAWLPAIVEPQLQNRLPRIAEQYPIDFKIEKLGISSTFISNIRIAEGVLADSIDIRYAVGFSDTPRVEKITVSGLTIHARLDKENQISIGGMKLKSSSNQKTKMDISSFLPYLPEKFVLKNANLVLNIKGQEFLISLKALSKVQSDKGKIIVKAAIYPFGEKIDVLVDYDLETGIDKIIIEGKAFDSGHLDQFISKISDKARIAGPVDFTLSSSSPQKKWEIAVSQILIKAPLKTRLEKIKTTVLIDKQRLSAQGDLYLQSLQIDPVPLEYNVDFDLKNMSVFAANIKTAGIKTLLIRQKSGRVSLSSPGVTIKINGTPEAIVGKINIDCRAGNFISKDQKLSFKNSIMRLDLNRDVSGKEKIFQMKGAFFVPYIAYNGEHIFSTRGNIVQTGSKKIAVKGTLDVDALKQAKTGFNIVLDLEDKLQASAGFNIAPFKLTHNDIKKWMPSKIKSAEFDMMADVTGSADWMDNKLKTAMQVNLKNGTIDLPDAKLTATGMNTSIQFNDLLVPETVPGQILTIDSIVVDKLKISDVQVRFSLEDGASVLAENIRLKWCNGTVTTEAIRFPRENDNYALSLYCDRLDLAQFLQQMEIFDVNGTGTVNGRIPVAYSDGIISFDNGFLFSSPGIGGKIKIKDTEKITKGIPMTDPGFIQLDLTREALKDFDYTWANLSFNTFEDALYLNISLNGKPAKNLPFEPLETGGFVRVDDSKPGSELEGLQLDVNLNLPFNEVLKFGNKIKSLFN